MDIWLKKLEKLIIFYKSTNWTKETYACYLAQTYHYVKYSTRLLAYASSQMPIHQNKHFYQCIKHVYEEKEHEILAQKDIEALGYNLSKFKEFSITKVFYQSQYFYINQNAYSFLGYVIALELLATQICSWFQNYAVSLFGTKTASFMAVHAIDDIEHVQKVFNIINELDSETKDLIWENFNQSVDIFLKVLQESTAN